MYVCMYVCIYIYMYVYIYIYTYTTHITYITVYDSIFSGRQKNSSGGSTTTWFRHDMPRRSLHLFFIAANLNPWTPSCHKPSNTSVEKPCLSLTWRLRMIWVVNCLSRLIFIRLPKHHISFKQIIFIKFSSSCRSFLCKKTILLTSYWGSYWGSRLIPEPPQMLPWLQFTICPAKDSLPMRYHLHWGSRLQQVLMRFNHSQNNKLNGRNEVFNRN